MKKLLGALLVVGLGALLISGCQTATSTAEPTIPADNMAQGIYDMTEDSLAIDGLILGITGSLSVSDVNATAVTTPEYGSDGWWSFSDSYTTGGGFSYTRTFKLKIWDALGAEITTLAALAAIDDVTDISKIWLYATWTVDYGSSMSYTIKFGASTSDPLKFEGYNTASQSISGPISYTSTYEDKSLEITYTYSSLQMAVSGYPDGDVSFSVKENGATVVSGTISFNGTNIATLTFTSGYTNTYTINLDTGVVTPASI